MKRLLFLLFTVFLPMFVLAQVHGVKKGDILIVNGVKGIVFSTDNDGEHGRMMSVKAFRGKENLFCSKSSMLRNISMRSETDGKANTAELLRVAEENHIDLVNYPVFKWCKSLGIGWYIPSIEEMKIFINYWVGNTDVEVDWDEDEDVTSAAPSSTPHTKIVNDLLMQAGGTPFLNGVFTSTLDADKKLDIFEYNKIDGRWTFNKVNPMKVDSYCVGRAFFDF